MNPATQQSVFLYLQILSNAPLTLFYLRSLYKTKTIVYNCYLEMPLQAASPELESALPKFDRKKIASFTGFLQSKNGSIETKVKLGKQVACDLRPTVVCMIIALLSYLKERKE